MRVRRRRSRFWGIFFAVLIVALAIFALFGYIIDRRVRTSPEYTAKKLLFVLKQDGNYSVVYIDSSKGSVRVVNFKDKEFLYDPQTGLTLTDSNMEKDIIFFKEVFGISSDYSYYLDLTGGNVLKFSREVLGRNVKDLFDLVNAMRLRKGNLFDSIRVNGLASKFRLFSNITGPALLKLMDAMSSYVVSEYSEVDTLTDHPVKIVVGKEKEKVLKRLYLTEESKEKIRSFLHPGE